jgi:hypothetical protein
MDHVYFYKNFKTANFRLQNKKNSLTLSLSQREKGNDGKGFCASLWTVV